MATGEQARGNCRIEEGQKERINTITADIAEYLHVELSRCGLLASLNNFLREKINPAGPQSSIIGTCIWMTCIIS